MQPKTAADFLTVEDYLAGELESQVRHEYPDGETYAMVGASDRQDSTPSTSPDPYPSACRNAARSSPQT